MISSSKISLQQETRKLVKCSLLELLKQTKFNVSDDNMWDENAVEFGLWSGWFVVTWRGETASDQTQILRMIRFGLYFFGVCWLVWSPVRFCLV